MSPRRPPRSIPQAVRVTGGGSGNGTGSAETGMRLTIGVLDDGIPENNSPGIGIHVEVIPANGIMGENIELVGQGYSAIFD